MPDMLFSSPGPAQPAFLPTTRAEMDALGWNELDVLLVTGDAYVDHPTFGMALIGRVLMAHGFRTGVVAQPRWDAPDDVARMGRPRLYAGVTAGALDSMLAHYTAFRKKRSDDAYTPGGLAGARPNRASVVYTNLLRRAFPKLPVVLGGIEASLRRITHYDFWTDKLRRSILLDAKADLVIYGMGERASVDVARTLAEADMMDRADPRILRGIPGTAVMGRAGDMPDDAQTLLLPSHEEMLADSAALLRASLLLEEQVHARDLWAVQPVGDRRVILAPPAAFLSEREMDALYDLPFARRAHPSHKEPIPALEMIRDSITSHRGCGGGCSFCSLALHQGRRIRSRSRESILREAGRIAAAPGFKGQISDVGGPSANMWRAACAKAGDCRRMSCMTPTVCPNFEVDQAEQLAMLRAVKKTPGVKQVRVASGNRFDLALQDRGTLREYLGEFVGGQLKIAPEHICDHVLRLMRKPGREVFERFIEVFQEDSERAGKKQFVIPYLISAFPGCTEADMRALRDWLRARNWEPQQVQCFIPTPGTVATAMFHAEVDPEGRPLPVARTDAERLRQHYLLAPGRNDGKDGRGFGGARHGGASAGKGRSDRRGGKSGAHAGGKFGGKTADASQGAGPDAKGGGKRGASGGPTSPGATAEARGARKPRPAETSDDDRRGHRSGDAPGGRPRGKSGAKGRRSS